ncbi:multi-sensor hybrid histidine kinase [Shewanella psychrophila]|uniref:Sensor protein FixL n=1 Tax=Shewanella psychrophila TaxID=225848 RepID=A0A1S6HLT3_9GAMM|nr:PAS domain S-box protein [Shewanella psychrophila]AQS36473.1 multi-sensor hybrid histidine kinase [Shewanella psychrophila]
MLTDLKFRTQLLMSYAVILSFMLGIAIVVFFSIKSLEDDLDWVNHTHDVLAKAAEIETIAIDMETGMRGYLLAGKSEFLTPYERGDEVFHEQVKSLIIDVEDNPEQVRLLEEIMATIDEWHVEVTKPVIALRAEIGDSKSMNDMADVIKQARGKQYFDKFRAHIKIFIEREKESVKKSHDRLKSSTNTQDLKRLEEVEVHSYRAITMAQGVLAAAVDMETGMRGFLLSGQEHFLDPYKEGSVRFHQLQEELSVFVADNTLQVSTLAGSQTIIDSWISEVVKSQIELRREIGDAKTMDDMADLVGEAKGKVYFDKFRDKIEKFRDTELILLALRKESLADTESLVTQTTIFGTLLAIFVGLGIAFRLTTRIVSQLGGEPAYIAEIARKVSNGDLNVELKGDENAQGIFAEMKQMMVTLKDKANLAQKIAAGELDQVTKLASDKDVLGLALKEMLRNLNSVANQADALASGDFTKEVVIKSDKDRLGTALHEMKSQINERNASLSMSLNLNQGIVNTAVDGIISIKDEGTILSVNSATERMFKYSAKALIGNNIKMLMPEPFHSEHDSYLSQYKKTGIKSVIGKGREVVALCSDGSTFPIFLSVGEVKQGEGVMYTGFIRDISVQKKFEMEILKSESLNKGLVNTSLDAIVSISPEGVILSCNQATEILFRYTSEQMIGHKVNMLMPSPYTEEHDSYLKNYLSSGVKKVIGMGRELVGLRSDGSQFPIFLSVGEVVLETGKVFTGFIRDISEQKKFEQEMVKSETLNRGMVNTCLDAILSISSKGEIIACNSAAEALFQYRSDELMGNKINTLMPSPFTEEHDSYLNNYLTTGVKKIIGQGREVIGLKKDGSTFPMYLTVGEVKQGDETVFTGFVRDITKEKQYEQDLRQTNDDLLKQNELKNQVSIINELTQGASELVVMADNIISALAEMMQAGHGVLYICGEESDDLSLSGSYAFKKRKAILSIIPLGEGLVGQCAKEKKTILLTQVPGDYIQINSGLGESTPMNVLVVPVLFEEELMGVIELATFQTFSDEQVEVIELICSNLGIVINNLRSQQRTQTLLLETQRQAEELQAQQEELKSSNESLMEQTQLLKTSEEELRQQSEELKVSNEELEEKQVFLKRQKDEIEAAKVDLTVKANELALASKYKSEFLANMSHELRTPLNSLLLLAKGLADNKSKHLDETEVEDAKVIFDGGNNLLCLINDIMDLSKVEAGKLTIHIEEVNLSVLSRNLKQVFDPIAKSRGLKFIINLDEKLPQTITSDGQRVEQVLRNLLSNAFKFTENGTVSLNIGYVRSDTLFSHSSLDVNKALSLAVVDTGIGIPSDKLQAIFEAFQQQDGSTSRKYGGTGLGLTIARELTRLLGGEIQLESSPNQGSTFTLYLPSKFDSDGVEPESLGHNEAILSEIKYSTVVDELDSPSKRSGISSGDIAKHDPVMQIHPEFISDDRKNLQEGDRSLLIVDDDKVFAKILRDHARENGYKCLVAGDGRTGIYLAQEYQPDGIILDIMLPDIDGHKVLEQLKFSLKTRHIPVEIISAHSDDKNSALVQGAIGLQTKPVSQEQLLTVFDEIRNFSASELRHVLVVEDDIANQTSIIRLLENSDIDIKCVDNGSQGVDEIMSGKYDCVILDLGLPDFSGFEVLKRIDASELTRVPPVIIYTGKEITDEEQDELNKYSSTIVIKGVGSAERLLDDISLFLHDIESRFCVSSQKTIHLLHDEDSMLKGRKVLLADDDMRNTYALSKKLIEIGFDVEMAHNGKEAVELLEQDKNFELVLMDTMMPEMDGYEATQKIRALSHYKHIPIIALTAKAMPEDREKSLQAGASEYLTKPIDFDKLLSIMRIWLFRN